MSARLAATLAFSLLFGATVFAADPAPAPTVTFEGFGNLKAGMTVKEAEAALGYALTLSPAYEDPICQYYTPAGAPEGSGLAFMSSDGKIVRVDIYEPSTIRTAEGAGVGDTEAAVMALYPKARVEPHPYTGPEGHYLVVSSEDGKHDLLFETDGGKIVSFRSGFAEAVAYIEGCS